MNTTDPREVILGGEHRSWRHLIPLAKLLIERGHPVIDDEFEYGFIDTTDGVYCQLGRGFTDEDWAAINERFILPDTIVFFRGFIRDNVNGIDMVGVDAFKDGNERLTFDDWEELERQAGRRR